MRAIKFRAWSNKWGKMIHHGEEGYTISVMTNTVWKDLASDEGSILMQCIGLPDKNGKEIYEGDIGELFNDKGEPVRFVVEHGIHRRTMPSGLVVDIPGFAFIVKGFPTFPIVDNYSDKHDLEITEVIGNIYEHPHLLTDKQLKDVK